MCIMADVIPGYHFERISQGATHRAVMPDGGRRIYLTVNRDDDGKPFEIFARYDVPESFELIMVITRLASMALREGVPLQKIAAELSEIHSPITMHMVPDTLKLCPSLTARIGSMLCDDLKIRGGHG
jgi:hypothetical protein